MATKPDSGSELNLIAAGTVFEGKLRTPGSIRIDGKIVGEVSATQNISVGNSGDVDGNVSAKNITIGGTVKGAVVAQEKLVFESKAVVRGDIRAARLVIDEGAAFDGNCKMAESKAAPNLVEIKQDQRRVEDR
ncbi:MAG: polymer-forming cytoskeletal protein [Ignavibacteria bacterium]|nr:polymer-forming cytoskeletal protein [Ignavibacteria bacterium]MBI3765386.1 polymer-forming cytoskeletal protein [Ignavibacteriales bacterium]